MVLHCYATYVLLKLVGLFFQKIKWYLISYIQADSGKESSLTSTNMIQEDSHLSILPSDLESLDVLNQHEMSFPLPGSDNNEHLALVPVDSDSHLVTDEFGNISDLTSLEGILHKKVLPVENPREMMARWKVDNLDLKTVVKDALLSGRLPLAVLQLHLFHQLNDFVADGEPHDTFTEIRDIGRAVAYELFLKVMYVRLSLAVTNYNENNKPNAII